MLTLLIIIAVLATAITAPLWSFSYQWGWWPSGGFAILTVVFLLTLLMTTARFW